MKLLIIDGYSAASRAKLEEAGMTCAWQLYANMTARHLPKAAYEVFFPSDSKVEEFPVPDKLRQYAGIIWTGADLAINDTHEPTIEAQIGLAAAAYEVGVNSWGSCWGIQMAAVAAGGSVIVNPRGREMGIGRKIAKTEAGLKHPMMSGKPPVFYGFESHYDIVHEVPAGGTVLAENPFSGVQALVVNHKKGTFWATQYHTEYNLHEMARLTTARAQVLTDHGFFANLEDVEVYVEKLEELFSEPERKDLLWQLGIGREITDNSIREAEFINWTRFITDLHP